MNSEISPITHPDSEGFQNNNLPIIRGTEIATEEKINSKKRKGVTRKYVFPTFLAGLAITAGVACKSGSQSSFHEKFTRDCENTYHLPKKNIGPLGPLDADHIADTPPLGFNTYNPWGLNISEDRVIGAMQAMEVNCMQQAGYQYVVLDDGWQKESLDSSGNLVADSGKFPHGIKYLADYAHEHGLRLGIYIAVGDKSCYNLAGSLGYEEQHVKQFAEWGVDYIKADWCGEGKDYSKEGAEKIVKKLHDAIDKYGRPMVLSISDGGGGEPWNWPKDSDNHEVINMWRTGTDVTPVFKGSAKTVLGSIYDGHYFESANSNAIRRGHFADLDMLQVGNNLNTAEPSLTDAEGRSQITMWAIASSPLIAGNDLWQMSRYTQDTLVNPEILEIDQDKAAHPMKLAGNVEGVQIWTKQLSGDGQEAVVFLNTIDKKISPKIDLQNYGINPASVRDLWEHKDLGAKSTVGVDIAPHGVAAFRVSVKK